MIPAISNLFRGIQMVQRPSLDYRIHLDSGIISGTAQGQDAIAQSIYKRLYTQRYAHAIYSKDYGMELHDLYGMPMDYIQAVLPGRITETLLQDSRIRTVTDFSFSCENNKLLVSFSTETNVGEMRMKYEVNIDV